MKVIFFIVTTLIYTSSFAQKVKEDVIYLKNGNVLKGKIEHTKENHSVILNTYSGNKFYFSNDEIDSIKSEKIKHLDIFFHEKEKLNRKLKFVSNYNLITGIHSNFGLTKTITNQLLIDAGVRLRNKFSISAGLGFIQYLNLSPNENILINGANNYTAIPHKDNFTNEMKLLNFPFYGNLSIKLFNMGALSNLNLSIKTGYFFHSPQKFFGIIRTERRNNTEVYNLSYEALYNQRMFIHPEFTMQIPAFENKTQFKLGLGYYLDYLTINYNYTENTFINTNYMLPSAGYWQKREYSQKEKAHLGFLTFCVGLSF
jgi:hypothetical protein